MVAQKNGSDVFSISDYTTSSTVSRSNQNRITKRVKDMKRNSSGLFGDIRPSKIP
jgi:hypothetical protein